MVSLATGFTLARIILVPVFIFVLYLPIERREWIAAFVFCIAALTDAFDGYFARKYNATTRIGALLDPIADKLLVISALIFLIGKGVPAWMAWILIAREFAIIGLRLIISPEEMISPSLFGKLKTALEMIGIVGVLLHLNLAWYVLFAAVVCSIVSAAQYFWRARKVIRL